MDRKVLLALGVSVAIFLLYSKYVMLPQAPPEKDAPTAGSEKEKKDKPEADKPEADKPEADKPEADKPEADKPEADKPVAQKPEAKPASGKESARPRQPEVLSNIEIDGRYRATLSSWGAALHDLVLVEPRYKENGGAGGGDIPIDLVPRKDAPLPYAVSFPDSGFTLPEDADFTLSPVDAQKHELTYTWSAPDGAVQVTKRYQFIPGTYEIQLTVQVDNKGDKALPASMKISLSGRQNPDVQPSMLRPSVVQTEGLCSTGKVKREALAGLLKEPLDVGGPVRVVAIDRKYFVLAAAITPKGSERCHVVGAKNGTIIATLTTGAETIQPGQSHSWSLLAFAGPKVVAELDAVKVGEVDAHLGDVMNYGFTEIFARPMLWVLKTVHRGIGNWGVAIILLTLLIKLITWWPTAQSMKSAAAMARLKPEMDKLKEKFGEDKARMNQEVMALYQKHKINPLGGCLPVLIQMPVYIALYSMLGNSVELYRAGFGLWIHDLTGPDPYFVLPLLTGAIMFLQQKLSPTPPDPSQKTMMTIMPVMFTGMSIFLPAGLTLYILTNTALSMVQQRISTPTKDAVLATAIVKKKANK